MLAAEQGDISLLDVVGVRDAGGPVRRAERPEARIGLMFCKQSFGRAAGCDLVHGLSPFFAIRRTFRRTVKAGGYARRALSVLVIPGRRVTARPESIRFPA